MVSINECEPKLRTSAMSVKRNEYFQYDDESDESDVVESEDNDDQKSLDGKDSPVLSIDDTATTVNESDEKEAELIEISDDIDDVNDNVIPDYEAKSTTNKLSPCGLKRELGEVFDDEVNDEDGKRKNRKQSTPSIKKTHLNRDVTRTVSMEFQFPFYYLMKILAGNNRIEILSNIDIDVSYDELQRTMLLQYRTSEEISDTDLRLLVYESIREWETRALKLSLEKMKFFESTDSGLRRLDAYSKKGLALQGDDRSGHGTVFLKNMKLLGVATFKGGVSAIEKQLEMDIESKTCTLKEEEVKLLEEWEEFKKKDDLMIIQKENCNLVLVGGSSSITTFWKKMNLFLEENSNFSLRVTDKREAVIKYLELHGVGSIKEHSSQVKAHFGRGFVDLSGKKSDVVMVGELLQDLISKMEISSFEMSEPGLEAGLFKSNEKARKSLKEIEMFHRCAIWVTDRNKQVSPSKGIRLSFSNAVNQIKNYVFGKSEKAQKDANVSPNSTQVTNTASTTQIVVKMGDITSSKDSTVLVNTLVSRKSKNLVDCGAVSKSFLTAGGNELQQEFEEQNLPQKFGIDLVSTKATGNLHCKEIFHIYVSKYKNNYSLKLMKDAIRMCVNTALSKGYSSIAFPSIGCGKLRYNIKDVCQCFHEVEEEILRIQNASIQIIIYMIDRHLHDQFINFLSSAKETNMRPLTPETANEEWEDLTSNADKGEDVCHEKVVTFNVCTLACNKDIIASIQDSVTDKLKNLCGEKKLEHDLIADFESLSPECKTNILTAGNGKVSLQIDKDALYLRGPSDDVKKIRKKIKLILDEEKKLLNDPAYLRKAKGTKAFLEYYVKSENIPFPKNWKNYGRKDDDLSMFVTPLDPNDKLFKEICKLVNKTWEANKAGGQGKDAKNLSHFNMEVKNIYLIENPRLFYSYRNQQKTLCYVALQNKNKSGIADLTTNGEKDVATKKISSLLDDMLIPEINEYYLFHGTKVNNIEAIKQQGIDSRVCGENAMFGRGAYFAESPTKADQYTDDKLNRSVQGTTLSMFMSRVLLGYSYLCIKPQQFSRPPCSESNCAGLDQCNIGSHKLSDSVVGLFRNDGSKLLFREFVVYKSDQSYPEFLIEYVRK